VIAGGFISTRPMAIAVADGLTANDSLKGSVEIRHHHPGEEYLRTDQS
jgi:hypothetical protein